MFEPAVVFAVEGVSRHVLDLLEEADWRVMRVRRPAEIGEAWAGIATSHARGDVDGAPAPSARARGSGGRRRPGRDGDGCILIPCRSHAPSDSR